KLLQPQAAGTAGPAQRWRLHRARPRDVGIEPAVQVADQTLLIAEHKTGKSARLHTLLHTDEIVHVLIGHRAQTALAVDAGIVRRAARALLTVPEAIEALLIEQHAAGIGGMRAGPQSEDLERIEVDLEVRKDMEVMALDELLIAEPRTIDLA